VACAISDPAARFTDLVVVGASQIALGLFSKQPLTEHSELMADRGVLTLNGGELFLKGRDHGASAVETGDGRVEHERQIRSLI